MTETNCYYCLDGKLIKNLRERLANVYEQLKGEYEIGALAEEERGQAYKKISVLQKQLAAVNERIEIFEKALAECNPFRDFDNGYSTCCICNMTSLSEKRWHEKDCIWYLAVIKALSEKKDACDNTTYNKDGDG